MSFEIITKEKWIEAVNQQLKDKDYTNLFLTLEEDLQAEPYYTQQSLIQNPLPSYTTQFLTSIEYKNSFSDGYICNPHTIKNTENVYVECNNIQEILELEEKYPTNSFTYWLDIFTELETTEKTDIHFSDTLDVYDTLAEEVQGKIQWIIDIDRHQNAGANYSMQLAIVLLKMNEIAGNYKSKILQDICIKVSVSGKYIEEIAKLRAITILAQNFAYVYEEELTQLPIIATSTQRNKTLHDTENNLIRSTLEISAAMLAGSKYIQLLPFSIENKEWANEVSLKQAIILAKESLLSYYNDALAGSYSIEQITQKIASKSWETFKRYENKGGYVKNFTEILEKIHYQNLKEIEAINQQKTKIVGLNVYEDKEFIPILSNPLQNFF